jgi:hypothetical protein
MGRDVRVCCCSSIEMARQVYDVYSGRNYVNPMYCSDIALHNVNIPSGLFSYEEVLESIRSILDEWEDDPDAEALSVWSAILREMGGEGYVVIRND